MTQLLDRLRALRLGGPLTVAHRGDSEAFPENTLPAFEAAVRAGAQMIEFDVQRTRDGALVVVHDDTLDRTTDARAVLDRGHVPVGELTLAQLQRLDAGTWKHPRFAGARVPTLEEALARIGGAAVPMIEHKSGTPEAYVAALRTLGRTRDVILQSFDWRFVERAGALEPDLLLGVLGDHVLDAAARDRVLATGAPVVHWDWTRLGLDDLAALRAAGRLVCVYTVNPDVAMVGALRAGIDMIVTNRPARLRELTARPP
jgi:glycerophosphoryl diester phosphodiesterase